jgi:hypothetical protein
VADNLHKDEDEEDWLRQEEAGGGSGRRRGRRRGRGRGRRNDHHQQRGMD